MATMNNSKENEKRVVSFFIWDPKLEHKINCEIKMIDGISKLLNVVTTIEQTIECHKALVLSQQRILAFMSEIQRKQQNLLKSDNKELEPTKATVILSDIRLPLVWTNMKGKSEQKKFAVFCLARIGCEIIDTEMKSIDKHSTEILFQDKIIFENVPYNFQLDLEIYALNKSFALSTSAKDFANRYSYFSTNGLLNLIEQKQKFSSNNQQSKFILIARTIFTKESVCKTAQVRHLNLEPIQENRLMQLPIHTSFISSFLIQPLCYTRLATFAGIIKIYNIRYSCILRAGFFNGEEIMRNDYSDQHRFSLPITPDTVISSCEDELSFSIYNHGFDQEDFFVEDLFTLNNWIRALQQHIVDIRAWQTTFEHIPSIRRYSYQSLTSTPIALLSGQNLTRKSRLTTKARSLDDLHQTSTIYHTLIMNRIDQSKSVNHINDQRNTDDNELTEYYTRL